MHIKIQNNKKENINNSNAFFDNYYGSIFDNLDKVNKYLGKEENTKSRQEKWKTLINHLRKETQFSKIFSSVKLQALMVL